MEYEKIKEWLDKLVDSHIESQSLEEFNNQIRLVSDTNDIQIYKGIHILADVMGFELKMKKYNRESYPYEYFFSYRDFEFFQLEEELLYAGTD